MRYRNSRSEMPGISYRNSYIDVFCPSHNSLKNKDIKFNQFTEIFLDNQGRGGINSFQSFDGCAFVKTIFLFH